MIRVYSLPDGTFSSDEEEEEEEDEEDEEEEGIDHDKYLTSENLKVILSDIWVKASGGTSFYFIQTFVLLMETCFSFSQMKRTEVEVLLWPKWCLSIEFLWHK